MKRRRIAVFLGLALALGGGSTAWIMLSKDPAPTYRTVTPDRGTIAAKVTATGTLSAVVTVQVGSQISGRVQEIFADFNSPVRKGQVLAKIDPQLTEAAVNQARANFLEAKSNYSRIKVQAELAEKQYQRTKQLADQRLIATADLDSAVANRDAAEAQVTGARASMQRAEASLKQAEVNLDYTTIVSPIDGVVISRDVDTGQTVAASLQAPTLFVIAQDLRKIQVDTSIAEADMGKMKPGMKAEFTVDAYPDETFVGTVRQIRNSAVTVQNVVTYNAIIDVENPELKLKPGMTANVSLIHDERANALRIPNSVLRFRPAPGTFERPTRRQGEEGKEAGMTRAASASASADGPRAGRGEGRRGGGEGRKGGGEAGADRRTVWLLLDGKPKPVRIKTGLSDGNLTEVVDGDLTEQSTLIVDASNGDSARNNESSRNGRPQGQNRTPRMF
ncbi:Macrolide export protein MacA [compost metagenome]